MIDDVPWWTIAIPASLACSIILYNYCINATSKEPLLLSFWTVNLIFTAIAHPTAPHKLILLFFGEITGSSLFVRSAGSALHC